MPLPLSFEWWYAATRLVMLILRADMGNRDAFGLGARSCSFVRTDSLCGLAWFEGYVVQGLSTLITSVKCADFHFTG